MDKKRKERDKFSRFKKVIDEFLLDADKFCLTNQKNPFNNELAQKSTINYVSKLFQSHIIHKINTAKYGLNKKLVNKQYFNNIQNVSNFISCVMCKLKPSEAKQLFQYFFEEVPKGIKISMLFQCLIDFENDEILKSGLLSDKYSFFHTFITADNRTNLNITFRQFQTTYTKLISPLKSFILSDSWYLCFYDYESRQIEFLKYSAIVQYDIESKPLTSPMISEEKIANSILDFIQKNDVECSISFMAFPELIISLMSLDLMYKFEEIPIPNTQNFNDEEFQQRSYLDIGINPFNIEPSLNIGINDFMPLTNDLEFGESFQEEKKKAFRIYGSRNNLIYIVKNNLEFIDMIDYEDIQDEINLFLTNIKRNFSIY